MGDRSTFTDEEWAELQWAVMLAGSHITGSDWPGLWNSFKEAAAGSHVLTVMQGSDNALVAALAKDQARKRPPDVADRADLGGDAAVEHIRRGAALVADKAPEDLEDFRLMLLTLAKVVAEELDGVSEKEAAALDRVRAALGDD